MVQLIFHVAHLLLNVLVLLVLFLVIFLILLLLFALEVVVLHVHAALAVLLVLLILLLAFQAHHLLLELNLISVILLSLAFSDAHALAGGLLLFLTLHVAEPLEEHVAQHLTHDVQQLRKRVQVLELRLTAAAQIQLDHL